MHHFFFKNIVQVFIKFTHSSVAIELLTFCNNAKKTILLLKSALGIPYINKIDFLAFCVYKNVSQKNWFLYMNENYNLPSSKDNAHVYIHKNQNNCETFLYTKSKTIFKKLDNSRYVFIYKKPYTLRYGIFHEIFEVGIKIQK